MLCRPSRFKRRFRCDVGLGQVAAILCGGGVWVELMTAEGTTAGIASETEGSFDPLVSVLVPAWNVAATLDRCLASLLAIDHPPSEVIVCAGGNDGTWEIAERAAEAHPRRITLIAQRAGEGKQGALRDCLARARGDILYLTDADCVVPPDTLQRLTKVVTAGEADAATGGHEPFPEQVDDPWVRHQWATLSAGNRGGSAEATGLMGRNSAVSRAAAEAAGGFREAVPIGTDYHLAKTLLRAGRRIRFVPASVQTHYPEGLGPYLRQQSRWLRNILIHGPRFGAWSEVFAVVRTIGLGWGLLLWPLSWRWTRRPGAAVWLLILAWMVRVRHHRQRNLEREEGLQPAGRWVAWCQATVYTAADIIAWAYPIIDLVRPGSRLRW
jgi:glycosyltransferase involved in cell wall biosynthesis